jgi:hypothetical protein
MEAHFNPAVGRHVSNGRDFRDALKRASDEASENTGMEHRYVPIDMRDRDATRVGHPDDVAPHVREANARVKAQSRKVSR